MNIFENFLWSVWKLTPKDLGLRKVEYKQKDLRKPKRKRVYTKKSFKRMLKDYHRAIKALD